MLLPHRVLALVLVLALSAAVGARSDAAALPVPPPPPDLAHIARQLTPIEQRLELELDPLAARWNGSLTTQVSIHQSLRYLVLSLTGPVPSRVELTDVHGKVELLWAVRDDRLLIETRRPVRPGRAFLFVAFDGEWSANGRGLQREGTGAQAHLLAHLGGREAARVFPCWPGDPATRWTLRVHAPQGWTVRADRTRAAVHDDEGRWRTTTLRTRSAVRASALTLELAPVK